MAVLRRLRRAAACEAGTMSVEMIVLVPVLLLIVMIAVAGGRLVSAEGRVGAASRDAARAASMERSAMAARSAANASLRSSVAAGDDCSAAIDSSDFGRGGAVSVTVTCHVRLSDLGLVFLPGTTTVSERSTSPVDTWRGSR